MENFESLYKIGEETVEQSLKTSQINFSLFLQEMENEFARLAAKQRKKGKIFAGSAERLLDNFNAKQSMTSNATINYNKGYGKTAMPPFGI